MTANTSGTVFAKFSWMRFDDAKQKLPFAKLRGDQRIEWECDCVSDEEADRVADELVGPIYDGPVQTAFGDALDRVKLGMAPRAAVEDVAVHYGLDDVAVENLVDAVEQDYDSNGVRW